MVYSWGLEIIELAKKFGWQEQKLSIYPYVFVKPGKPIEHILYTRKYKGRRKIRKWLARLGIPEANWPIRFQNHEAHETTARRL